MTKRIGIRPKASQDLDDHFAYIAENNLEAALQFFDSARSTIAQLARMPGTGNPYPIENPRLRRLQHEITSEAKEECHISLPPLNYKATQPDSPEAALIRQYFVRKTHQTFQRKTFWRDISRGVITGKTIDVSAREAANDILDEL